MSVLSVGRSPVYPFALDIVDMMVPFCWRCRSNPMAYLQHILTFAASSALVRCPMPPIGSAVNWGREGLTAAGTEGPVWAPCVTWRSILQVFKFLVCLGKQAFPTWNMVWSCLMAISWFQRKCFACFAIAKWDYLGQESESRYFSEQNDGKPWDWSAPIFQSKPIN